jgi:DNA-binding NtrC family response regulator
VAYSILIVDQHPRAAQLAKPLARAGYAVATATTFEAARERLNAMPPDLLIAAERLGLFNGLHLVLRARFDHPDMAAIVTADRIDPVLQAEAMSCGAACAAGSMTAPELLELVSRTFASRAAPTISQSRRPAQDS